MGSEDSGYKGFFKKGQGTLKTNLKSAPCYSRQPPLRPTVPQARMECHKRETIFLNCPQDSSHPPPKEGAALQRCHPFRSRWSPGLLLTRALQALAHDAPDEVAAEVAPRVRGGPCGLEVVAMAWGLLPCGLARGGRRDAQRVGTLQPGAARAGAPSGYQLLQLNELRLRRHGPLGRGFQPALGASECGAGGAGGRAAIWAPPPGSRQGGGKALGVRREGQWKPVRAVVGVGPRVGQDRSTLEEP